MFAKPALLMAVLSIQVLGCVSTFADNSSQNWQKLEAGGITVEYQAETEELAKKLIVEIEKRTGSLTPSPQSSYWKSDTEALIAHKDEALKFIANQLSLDSATQTMMTTFEQFSAACSPLFEDLRNCRCYRIWPIDYLKSVMSSGYKHPWLTYNAQFDSFTFGKWITDGSTKFPAVRDIPILIDIGEESDMLSQALTQVDFCLELDFPLVHVICHEVAEAGILDPDHPNAPFRRWFADGAAEYISRTCMRKVLGKSVESRYANQYDVSQYNDLVDQVDLLNWRAAEWDEWEPDMPYTMDGRLKSAHYAYACGEIQGLVDRHGEDVIPAIFKEIKNSKGLSEQAIFDAIKKVTGEDFKTRLSKYGKQSKDPLKGLAFRGVTFGIGERDGDQWRMASETDVIPFTQDDSRGAMTIFYYAVASPPANLRVEFTAPSQPDGEPQSKETKIVLTEIIGGMYTAFSVQQTKYVPGDAAIRLYANDTLVKEMKLKLVEASPETKTPSPDAQPVPESTPP